MGKIDLVIYILILLFTLIGYSKGFMKQVLSTANWLVALIGAFVFVKPFSSLMLKTTLSTNVNNNIADWISTKGPSFSVLFDNDNATSQLTDAIGDLGLPKFISSIIANQVDFSEIAESITLAEVLAPSIGNIVMNIISFVLLFFILFVLLKLIIALVNIVFEGGVLGIFNRLLGGALGFLKAALFISILMLVLSILSGVIPSINQFIVADLGLDSDGFSIGKYFYESNPLIRLIKGSFSFEEILG